MLQGLSQLSPIQESSAAREQCRAFCRTSENSPVKLRVSSPVDALSNRLCHNELSTSLCHPTLLQVFQQCDLRSCRIPVFQSRYTNPPLTALVGKFHESAPRSIAHRHLRNHGNSHSRRHHGKNRCEL